MARYTLPVITSFETPKRYAKRNTRIKCYFNIILTCGKTNILPFLFPASCTFLKFEFKFKQYYHILFFLFTHQCLFMHMVLYIIFISNKIQIYVSYILSSRCIYVKHIFHYQYCLWQPEFFLYNMIQFTQTKFVSTKWCNLYIFVICNQQ